MNILIIEDDKIQQTVLRSFIYVIRKDHSRIHTLVEDNAENALISLKYNNEIDLILTDFKMPGMDGINFSRHFRKSDKFTPIVMMTCNYEEAKEIIESNIKSGTDIGISDLIKKPLSFDKVKNIIYKYYKPSEVGHSINKMTYEYSPSL
jgi:CheY-like chemotaxis protein